MTFEVLLGILIPFFGTSLGAFCVFFLKKDINVNAQKALTGLAAGVMVAASVWSLLIPAMEKECGKLAFMPAVIGFWIGVLFLMLIDRVICKINERQNNDSSIKSREKTLMMIIAVVLHNIPEGMAVGVIFAGFLSGNDTVSFTGAMALAIGIAIQNFPEGAIVSMPLAADGNKKGKSFIYGVLSGIVEPIAAIITVIAAEFVIPLLPYFLSFAAGAMIYVAIEELIPEMRSGNSTYIGTVLFGVGFTLMMSLDVLLG